MFFKIPALLALASFASAQVVIPPSPAVASPSYFSTTGARASYYDQTLTETTNLGVHVTGASKVADVPAGLWATVSVDATARNQSSSAALRGGARYFPAALMGGNIIPYINIAAGATTSTTAAISATGSGTVSSSFLGNLQGGLGFIWRACHAFSATAKVNCIVDLDYELNAVSTQAVKPVIGLYVGLLF